MKIISFGDIHMDTSLIRKIPEIREVDLVLISGDLTNYGSVKEAKKVLDEIMEINPNVFAQFGNLDNPDINDYLEELDINLHGQARVFNREVVLIGVGGSNYTPFGTPSEFSEDQLMKHVTRAHDQAQSFNALADPLGKQKIPLILVSHPPPYGTKTDLLRSGRHVGSTAIRTFITQHQPDLCITGHIHESKGQDAINNTPIYNPGMLRHGGWLTINIHQSELTVTLQ